MDEESYKIIPKKKKAKKYCCCPNESFSIKCDKMDADDTADLLNSSTSSSCSLCTMVEDEMKEYFSLVSTFNL